jgi:multidrug efflux pump
MVSLLISLTTTPMLCARWLGKENPNPGRFFRGVGRLMDSTQNAYQSSLNWALNHSRTILLILVAIITLNIYLYKVIDKGFFPTQDGGRLNGMIQADQGTSFWSLQKKLFQFAELIKQDPAVSTVVGYAGAGLGSNIANVSVVLKAHDQRPDMDEIMERIRQKISRIPGARLNLYPEQELRIGGRPSAGLFYYALQSDDLDLLQNWTPKVVAALAKLPELKDVNTNQQDKGQQIGLVVNREMAIRYGVTQAMIDASLNDAFGQRQVSIMYNKLNQYHVVMELAPEYWQSPEALKQLYISVPGSALTNGSTALSRQVPLASVASFAPTNTPISINHQDQFATSTISFNLQAGISLSTATALIQHTMDKIGVPENIKGSFQGSAKAFQASLNNQPWLILAALISVYVVLGILYESYLHPLTILSTLPSAGVGALLALMACKTEFSIIALIGVILLIGIVKKNAIMMIDFALFAEREQGLDARTAIYQACLLRFRPILMTTLAALFGALPLALGSGYGAELRQPLGISIVGGLIFSQMLTLYTTPVVYLYMDRLRSVFNKRFLNRTAKLADKPI